MEQATFQNKHFDDLEPARVRFREVKRVQVRDFLEPLELANWMEMTRAVHLPWRLHYRRQGRTHDAVETSLPATGSAERAAFMREIERSAREDFQFSYYSCPLAPADPSKLAPDHPLALLASRLLTPRLLSYLAALIQDPSIRGLTASLTRYDPGSFLLPHDDTDTRDDRRAAYVLNLSEDWWPDWGGLLQFIDAQRNVSETLTPHCNALNVFAVPQLHGVSHVAPYALRSRYAVTGWVVA